MGERGLDGGRPLELIPGGPWVEEFIAGATSRPVRHHRVSCSPASNAKSSALAGRPGLDHLEEENGIVDKRWIFEVLP